MFTPVSCVNLPVNIPSGLNVSRNASLYSGTVVTAQHGDQYVELDSHGPGSNGSGSNSFMLQNIHGLTAGDEYRLSFWYRPRTNQSWNDNGIDVYWGEMGSEAMVFSIANQIARNYSDWVQHSFKLTATSNAMGLGFYATGKQNTLGGFVDNVKLASVPVPATLALFGIGCLAFGASRCSRKEHL